MERSEQKLLESEHGAIFSKDRKKRYLLWRRFASGNRFVNFIMLNPSEADESYNDPTITRCIQFAKDWNFDGLIVSNLFSICTPYPKNISKHDKNLSALNKQYITFAVEHSEQTICAWGNHGSINKRSKKFKELLKNHELYCLDMNKNGEPKHPLYIKRETLPKAFTTENMS